MTGYRQWTDAESAALIAVPGVDADKYTRGVLGVVTGSQRYPGAAVLGVEAAIRTGVGMVRYLGAASDLVLHRRPEAVTVPGRVQAWLLGSGIDSNDRDQATTELLVEALGEALPTVIDSGGLDLIEQAGERTVITPHYRELAGVLGVDVADVARDPAAWCVRASDQLGVTVLLKGTHTHVASPGGTRIVVGPATGWLASAGTGDVLGGILGAFLATHSAAVLEEPELLPRLAASAAHLHAAAAELASAGGPLAALDVAGAMPEVVAHLLRTHPPL